MCRCSAERLESLSFLHAIRGTACSGTLPRLSGCGAVGSVLPWGGRGRRFKSGHSDQRNPTQFRGLFGIAWGFCVSGNRMFRALFGHDFFKKRKSQQKPSTESPLTVSFCLFLYGAASCSINIHVLFSSHSQAHFPAFGISYKFSDLFLSHPPIFLTKL